MYYLDFDLNQIENNLKIPTTFLKNKHFMLKVGILPPL